MSRLVRRKKEIGAALAVVLQLTTLVSFSINLLYGNVMFTVAVR